MCRSYVFLTYQKVLRYMKCFFFPPSSKKIPITISKIERPARISIISSIYNGDIFIKGFLHDIVQQTIFNQCELILINANSPGNEYKIILEYMKHYSNIIYIHLGYDPGLYGVWNIGIHIAQGKYLTNANIDDRVRYDCYELHAQTLDNNPDIDLVYSDIYITYKPNETMKCNSAKEVQKSAEFSIDNMQKCLPNDHPMWRKTMHEKYGLFDTKYISAGDYEMWLRATAYGAQFKKVEGILGLHYVNPSGLSTNPYNPFIYKEVQEVREKYQFLWKG